MTGLKWLGVLMVYALILLIILFGFGGSLNLVITATVLFFPVLAYAAYKDAIHYCRCKQSDCTFCKENKKYRNFLRAHLAGYFVTFLSIKFYYYLDGLYEIGQCGKMGFEDTLYCRDMILYNKIVLFIIFFAALCSIAACLELVDEAQKYLGPGEIELTGRV